MASFSCLKASIHVYTLELSAVLSLIFTIKMKMRLTVAGLSITIKSFSVEPFPVEFLLVEPFPVEFFLFKPSFVESFPVKPFSVESFPVKPFSVESFSVKPFSL